VLRVEPGQQEAQPQPEERPPDSPPQEALLLDRLRESSLELSPEWLPELSQESLLVK
jgi:hypothetical protein